MRFFSSIVILFLIVSLPVYATTDITCGDETIPLSHSGTFTVPVSMTAGSGETPVSVNFDFSYDETQLTYSSTALGAQATAAAKMISATPQDANTVRVIIFGLNSNVISDGELAVIAFSLAGTATAGVTPITIENTDVTDAVPTAIPSQGVAGSVDIQDASLPVQLSNFYASIRTEGIQLTWKTASEFENHGFHVYRSCGNKDNFVRINNDLIAGHGSSSESHTYHYTDQTPCNGTCFYKLEQVDISGETTEFSIISVTAEGPQTPDEFMLGANYPNPFNPKTTIPYSLPERSYVELKVYNLSGKLMKTLQDGYQEAGYYYYEMNANDLASGLYFYVMTTPSFRAIHKCTLMK